VSLSIETLSRLALLQPATLLLQVEIVGIQEVAGRRNLISTLRHDCPPRKVTQNLSLDFFRESLSSVGLVQSSSGREYAAVLGCGRAPVPILAFSPADFHTLDAL
jgi:hypothetical protein